MSLRCTALKEATESVSVQQCSNSLRVFSTFLNSVIIYLLDLFIVNYAVSTFKWGVVLLLFLRSFSLEKMWTGFVIIVFKWDCVFHLYCVLAGETLKTPHLGQWNCKKSIILDMSRADVHPWINKTFPSIQHLCLLQTHSYLCFFFLLDITQLRRFLECQDEDEDIKISAFFFQ